MSSAEDDEQLPPSDAVKNVEEPSDADGSGRLSQRNESRRSRRASQRKSDSDSPPAPAPPPEGKKESKVAEKKSAVPPESLDKVTSSPTPTPVMQSGAAGGNEVYITYTFTRNQYMALVFLGIFTIVFILIGLISLLLLTFVEIRYREKSNSIISELEEELNDDFSKMNDTTNSTLFYE